MQPSQGTPERLTGACRSRRPLFVQPAPGVRCVYTKRFEARKDDALQRLDIHLPAHGLGNHALTEQLRAVGFLGRRSEKLGTGTSANHPGK